MWGGGCGHGESTPVQNFTYLEPDSIISSLFVQSVIFGHSCVVCEIDWRVWASVCGCGCEELWVW